MPRAGRWWATRARKRLRRRPCCPSPSGRWTGRRAGSRAARQLPIRPAWARIVSQVRIRPRPPARLFTALRTGFALELLQEAFKTTRELRAQRRAERGLAPGERARSGQAARGRPGPEVRPLYLDWLRGWMSPAQAEHEVRLATSGERDAHESLAAFRLTAEPSILVTVAMAYEGLDAPEVAVVAALTHIRSRPWLEQMIARATRVDPNAGAYENQRALVYHPDDPLFAKFRQRIETEQGTSAARPKHKRQAELPLWLQERLAEQDREGRVGSRPGEQRARPALRHAAARTRLRKPARAREGPNGADRPTLRAGAALRLRIGEMIAAQVVEDEADLQVPRGQGLYRYNAVLKRVLGNKGRAEMTFGTEAALAWLERNRLADFLHFWTAMRGTPGWLVNAAWRPRTGRGRQGAREPAFLELASLADRTCPLASRGVLS